RLRCCHGLGRGPRRRLRLRRLALAQRSRSDATALRHSPLFALVGQSRKLAGILDGLDRLDRLTGGTMLVRHGLGRLLLILFDRDELARSVPPDFLASCGPAFFPPKSIGPLLDAVMKIVHCWLLVFLSWWH